MADSISEIQTRLRRLWTIFLLLDGEEHRQQSIVKKINKIDMYLDQYTESKNVQTRTTRSIESNILKYLEKKEIIERKSKDITNSNFKIKICYIPLNFRKFIKIITEINNNYVSESLERFYLSSLINSVFGKEFINEDFFLEMLKTYELPSFELGKNEKELIHVIFRTSPLALKYVVTGIVNRKEEWKNPDKKRFFLKILSYWNLDILDYSDFLIYPHNIDFQMIYSFEKTKEAVREEGIGLDWKNDHLELNMLEYKDSKDINCNKVLQTYLESYNTALKSIKSDLIEELSKEIVFEKIDGKKELKKSNVIEKSRQRIDRKNDLS